MKITHLRKRADFVRASVHGVKQPTRSIVLIVNEVLGENQDICNIRVGYTVTKKLGCAVIRNRIKRRLRAAVQIVLKTNAIQPITSSDYVLIGRKNALTSEFTEIVNDLKYALRKLNLTQKNSI